MKIQKYFISILFIFLFSILIKTNGLYSQWIQTSGPGGTNVYSIYLDRNNTWIGTELGIYFSSNNGISWIKRATGVPTSDYPYGFLRVGNYLFAAIQLEGIYYTTDNGISWHPCNNGIPSNNLVYSLLNVNNNILAATSNGIYLSSNNGTNWFPTTGDSSLIWPMVKYRNNVLAGGRRGIYLSSDNGFTWSKSNNGLDTGIIQSLTRIGQNVFALLNQRRSAYSYIFISTDGGVNWTRQSKVNISSPDCLISSGNNLFLAGGSNGIMKSTDQGLNWFYVNSGIYANESYTLAANRNYIVAGFTSSGGVFYSSNQGNSWVARNKNLTNITVNEMCINSNKIFAATWEGIHVSTDNGNNWSIIYPDLPVDVSYSFTTTVNYIFAGNAEGIYRSTNNGLNWTQVYSGHCFTMATNGTNVFGGSWTSILRSTNFGTTWDSVSNSSGIFSSFVSGDTVLAGCYGQIMFSSDNGNSFITILSNTYYGTIWGLAMNNGIIFAGSDFRGVMKSSDMGSNWTLCNNGIGSISISSLLLYQQDLFVTSDSIYFSSDFGASWVNFSDGLKGAGPRQLMIAPPYIYAGTYMASVWRRQLGEIVGLNNNHFTIPDKFFLYQNYPNPFNPSTIIKYQLATSSEVKLTIYDILGREVTTLVNEKQNAGTYEIQWNVLNNSSGVYFYKLSAVIARGGEAGYFTEIKKMILLK